jgi:hypothetical protein
LSPEVVAPATGVAALEVTALGVWSAGLAQATSSVNRYNPIIDRFERFIYESPRLY